MSADAILSVTSQGLLLGGLFALYAVGLSMTFGVMRIVNVAHGDFIVIAAYASLTVATGLGLHPFETLLVVAPFMGVLGFALQRVVVNHALGEDLMPPFLVTFGLSIVVQNGLLIFMSADDRRLDIGDLASRSFAISDGVALGHFPVVVFLTAVAVIGLLEWGTYHTNFGRNARAVADDPAIARLMGIEPETVFAWATAVSFMAIAVAGVLMGARTNFDPFTGPQRLLLAFETVVIGGLGSLWGTFAGGLILGLAQAVGGAVHPQWQLLAGHIVFLAILVAKPSGLFPRG